MALFRVDTEHSGLDRWFELQADDVSRFVFKLRIITDHVAAPTMGLESKLPPDSTDRLRPPWPADNCSSGSSPRSVRAGSVPKCGLRSEPCDGGARLHGNANPSQAIALA